MKSKTSDAPLDVLKIVEQLRDYENSPARGGLKIDMPIDITLRKIAKAKPEKKREDQKTVTSYSVT